MNLKCECCKTADAEWVIEVPTDATEKGELRCTDCAVSTCSDFAPISEAPRIYTDMLRYAEETLGDSMLTRRIVNRLKEIEAALGV